MENLIIKMVDEHYKTDNDIFMLVKYIAAEGKNKGSEKLLCCGGRGVAKKADKAAKQMIAVQKIYGKNNRRRLYQMIVSFPKGMNDKSLIRQIAENIAEMLFSEYQVFYGIHISRENWHIHFAINAVSYRTGKKWHQSKEELEVFKQTIMEHIQL